MTSHLQSLIGGIIQYSDCRSEEERPSSKIESRMRPEAEYLSIIAEIRANFTEHLIWGCGLGILIASVNSFGFPDTVVQMVRGGSAIQMTKAIAGLWANGERWVREMNIRATEKAEEVSGYTVLSSNSKIESDSF